MARGRVSALGSVSFGWLHAHGAFRFDRSFFFDPQARLAQERRMREFVAERFPRDAIYSIEAHLVQPEGRRRPVILVGGLQPNLILGAVVGARFVFYGDKDPDITMTPLAELRDVDRLRRIDWRRVWPIDVLLEQVRAARQQFGGQYAVVPPLFWDTTGRATIHGIITTAQKLLGDRVFLEMNDDPAFAQDLFHWIAESYAELIELFADAAELQITGLHVGDCSACMVGHAQFAKFVLPELNALSQRIGPLRLHSCGFSDHLLDVFRQLQNVGSLNVGSNTSVARIRQLFGPLRIDLLPDTQKLITATTAEMDAWVRRSVEENGHGELELQYHLDLSVPESNCLQIARTLESLGFACGREELY